MQLTKRSKRKNKEIRNKKSPRFKRNNKKNIQHLHQNKRNKRFNKLFINNHMQKRNLRNYNNNNKCYFRKKQKYFSLHFNKPFKLNITLG